MAVQIAPGDAAPALEQQLIRACNAGLEHARCELAPAVAVEKPRAVAMVSWEGTARVSIEVGIANGDAPLWVSRELEFKHADPDVERWRAVGLTIALLADDPRFWTPLPEPFVPASLAAPPIVSATKDAPAPEPEAGEGVMAELRALLGTGLVSGAWRQGAELRFAVPLSSRFFATASASYALASESAFEMRWFDASVGVGLYVGTPFHELNARARLELLGENVSVTVQRSGESDRASAWVPGISVGGDLLWSLAERWRLSARADLFWLDGSTAIVRSGEKLGTSASGGMSFGLGAGYRF